MARNLQDLSDQELEQYLAETRKPQPVAKPQLRSLQKLSDEELKNYAAESQTNKGNPVEGGPSRTLLGDFAEGAKEGTKALYGGGRTLFKGANQGSGKLLNFATKAIWETSPQNIANSLLSATGFNRFVKSHGGQTLEDMKGIDPAFLLHKYTSQLNDAAQSEPDTQFEKKYSTAGKAVKSIGELIPQAMFANAVVSAPLSGSAPQGLLSRLLQNAAKSGTETALIGEVDASDQPSDIPGSLKRVAGNFLGGAAIDLGTNTATEGIKGVYNFLKNPKNIRSMAENVPYVGTISKQNRLDAEADALSAFKQADKAKKAQYMADLDNTKQGFADTEAARKLAYDTEKETARELVGSLKKLDDIEAGTNLWKSVKKADIDLGKKYKAQTAPIFKKYSLKTVSPDSLRQEINGILKENNLMDKRGNILRGEIENILAPNRKAMLSKLVDISEALKSNPSVSKMNKLVQDLRSMANFKSATRSAEDEIFGGLSRTANQSMMDGIEKVAKEKDIQILRAARAKFSKNKPIFEDLGSASDLNRMFPEKVVAGAQGRLPQSFIKDVVAEQPSLKAPIAEVVRNNIVQKGTTPKTFTKAIDSFGRDNLKNLLGKEGFKDLVAAEKRFYLSGRPFVKGKMAKVKPFEPGTPPETIMKSIYKDTANFVGRREPGRILKQVNKAKYLIPSITQAANIGEIEVN